MNCPSPSVRKNFTKTPDHALEWGGGGYISLNEMFLVSSHPVA